MHDGNNFDYSYIDASYYGEINKQNAKWYIGAVLLCIGIAAGILFLGL